LLTAPIGFHSTKEADCRAAPGSQDWPQSTPEGVRVSVAECPVHHGYEPFAQKNPFPVYAALRAEEPVMYDERIGYWVITRYDDVKAVFDDWATFSSENAQAPVRERGAEAKRIMEEGGFTA